MDDPLEPHFSLAEAAAKFFPGGKVTARSLRTEIENGYLPRIKIAGKLVISESAIARMLELKRREDEQRLKRSRPANCFQTITSIERLERARAAALLTPAQRKSR